MKLLVVGAGEMGRWFAEALAAGLSDPPAVTFLDTAPGTAERAADAVPAALDARVLPPDADERFDAVAFAVPIPALEAAVDRHADRADRALVDLTGVMRPAVDALAAVGPPLERVSLHPLFAADSAPGNVAVVADAPGPVTDRVREGLTATGNDLFETTAAEHDEAMKTVQARAHAAVLAFGLAADDVPDGFQTPVSAELFDVLERVTGNDPRVYGDIQRVFEGADDVAVAARNVADADDESFARLYREAAPSESGDSTDDAESGDSTDDAESGGEA